MVEPTKRVIENAHKVTFLATEYPKHSLADIIKLLQLAAIDINASIWAAVDLGLITEPNPETGRVEVLKRPDKWQFGTEIEELHDLILYMLEHCAEKETDLDEYELSNWLAGYPTHNTLIALKQLLAEEKIATYVIEDGENIYTFYTTFEAKDKLFARKRFKKDPLADARGKNKKEEK